MGGTKQIKWGAIISYLSIAFNIIAGFIYTPWMIRTIGKDQYALYTLALSVINLFLLDFGIGSAISKFLTKYYAEGKQEEADNFMGIVYKVFFLIAACIAVALLVFYFFIDGVYVKLTPAELTVFKHLFIIIAVYSVLAFPCTTFNGVLMANERFIEVKVIGLAYKIFEIACIVTLLILDFGVYALVMVHAVSSLLFHFVRYMIIRRKTKQRTNIRAWSKSQAKDLFGVSIWITVMSIAKRCVFNIMPSIISALIGSTEVAYFGLATTIEGYIFTFANGINGMFLPKISRILTQKEPQKPLNDLMQKVGKFHVYTIGLIIVEFICFGKQFTTLWLGEGFEKVFFCAILIILPCLVDLPQQVAKTTLLAMDVIKHQALIYIAMAAISVVVACLLVPVLGAVGAAAAVFICYAFRSVAFNVLYHKKTPIQVGAFFKESYLKWLVPAAVSLAVGIVISAYVPQMSVIQFLLAASIVGIIYVVILVFACISKAERTAIINQVFHKDKKQ